MKCVTRRFFAAVLLLLLTMFGKSGLCQSPSVNNPDQIISRAVVAQEIWTRFKNDYKFPQAGKQPPFTDVPLKHPAFQSVSSLKSAKILTGEPNGTFGVGKGVYRYELAVILKHLADYVQANSNVVPTKSEIYEKPVDNWCLAKFQQDVPFADVPSDAWYYPAVDEMTKKRIMLPYGDDPSIFGAKRAVRAQELSDTLTRFQKQYPSIKTSTKK